MSSWLAQGGTSAPRSSKRSRLSVMKTPCHTRETHQDPWLICLSCFDFDLLYLLQDKYLRPTHQPVFEDVRLWSGRSRHWLWKACMHHRRQPSCKIGTSRFQQIRASRCSYRKRRICMWSAAKPQSFGRAYGEWNHIGFRTFL